MKTADEILEQAKHLPPDQRRRVAEELLDELDRSQAESTELEKGPYARWLQAAGSVHSDFRDLSTDKYKHVAAAALRGHDKA